MSQQPGIGTLARDLAFVGGVSALGAPGAFLLYHPVPEYFLTVIPVAAATGPLVALAYARAVGDARRRPAIMLIAVAVLMGLLWGAVVGLAGAFAEPEYAAWSVVLASLSAAFQLGWLAAPLARRAADGRRTWPLLAGAVVVSPVLGNVAYVLFGAIQSWLRFFA